MSANDPKRTFPNLQCDEAAVVDEWLFCDRLARNCLAGMTLTPFGPLNFFISWPMLDHCPSWAAAFGTTFQPSSRREILPARSDLRGWRLAQIQHFKYK